MTINCSSGWIIVSRSRRTVNWLLGQKARAGPFISAGIIADGARPAGATRLDHRLTRRRNMTE
jgi:hypothetical protein